MLYFDKNPYYNRGFWALNLLTHLNVIIKKGKKLTEPEKFKLSDILYGFVVPLIIGIVIVLFPAVLRPALDTWFPPPNMMTGDPGSPYAFLTVIFTQGFAMMVCMGIPLIVGLLWSKWAGGATGFITGTLFYLAYAGYNIMYSIQQFGIEYAYNLYADPSFIGDYIVGAILIGYIAGALVNKSLSFKRMLGASLTATIAVGVFTFILGYTVSFAAWMMQGDPLYAFFYTMLPMVILGIIAPILAKVMTWYGLIAGSHY
jgi:hypothetical protein